VANATESTVHDDVRQTIHYVLGNKLLRTRAINPVNKRKRARIVLQQPLHSLLTGTNVPSRYTASLEILPSPGSESSSVNGVKKIGNYIKQVS
jgi:hypothetical protein